MGTIQEFWKGILKENPIFKLALGLCPALAISTSVENAVGMGVSATVVLIGSNTLISSIRKWVPDSVRLPVFIVVIATFVTLVDLILKGFFPSLSASLGIFIPLIVVNCIILGRAEMFACKNPIWASFIDGVGMGAGFTGGLVMLAVIRELFGTGMIAYAGKLIVSLPIEPVSVMILAPGGLLTFGLFLALFNYMSSMKKG